MVAHPRRQPHGDLPRHQGGGPRSAPRGGGAIVNVASTMALGGTAHYAPYVASKWAIRGLTQTAAIELGRDHIRVNTIHPGVISTPFIHE